MYVYLNDDEDNYTTYIIPTSSSTDDGTYIHVFEIPFADFQVGDVITKLTVSNAESIKPWDTNEGIKLLVDGSEWSEQDENGNMIDTFHGGAIDVTTGHTIFTHTFKFNTEGIHTVEAVFVGNNTLQMATTGKHSIKISQPPVTEPSDTPVQNTGSYRLNLLDKNVSLSYNDGKKIRYQLTKGGEIVVDRAVERVTPTSIDSQPTNKQGIVTFTNLGYNAGKYKLGAYYWDEDNHKTITSTYKEYTIAKGTPTLTDNFDAKLDNNENTSGFIKNSTYVVKIKFQNKVIANEKVTMYVNNKAISKTTNKSGEVSYKFQSSGTFNIKTVWKGNKNIGKGELTRSITVPKTAEEKAKEKAEKEKKAQEEANSNNNDNSGSS